MNDTDLPTSWETELPESNHEHPGLPLQPDLETENSETEENKDQVTFQRSHLYALLLPLAFVLGLSVGYLFWGRSPGTSTTTAGTTSGAVSGNEQGDSADAASQAQSQTTGDSYQDIVRYEVPVDDDPIIGPEDAPITIIEFSDFECPYCRQWFAQVYIRLRETYPDQIRFVYRDFPLTSIHPNAFSAAEAANCAGDQGAYWDYHDQLFNQALGLGKNAYQQYAEQLDLDLETFTACLDTRKYEEEIQADFDFAAQLGVRSTPTFFINGIALVGAQPFETFQQVIEKELAGEIP